MPFARLDAVTDGERLSGLTQFPRRAPSGSLTAESKRDRGTCFKAPACAIIKCPTARKRLILKDGEMSEWLKEHARKAILVSVKSDTKTPRRATNQELVAKGILLDVTP